MARGAELTKSVDGRHSPTTTRGAMVPRLCTRTLATGDFMTVMLRTQGLAKTSPCICVAACSCRYFRRRSRRPRGRVRRAVRPLRRRQIDPVAQSVRELPSRQRSHLVRHDGEMVDIASADPRTILAVRHQTLGYVSQFLRVVPRVSALDVVAEVLMARGIDQRAARDAARALLLKLNIPARLHSIPPATFSGGEQQRVNLARGFIARHPILLLDEPTASLDAENRAVRD